MHEEWLLPTGLVLHLARPEDDGFLWSLFCSARPELCSLPLPPEQLSQLMRQQYESQQRSYRHQYPQLEHWIIANQSGFVGKIMFQRSQSVIHIIDFIIAPEWKRKGIGRAIINAIKAELASTEKLTLQVDRQNINAKCFYHQAGFVTSQSSDTHDFLVWS